MKKKLAAVWQRWTLGFLALAAIVTGYWQWQHADPTVIALTMLLFVLIVASRWGFRLALSLAVTSTLAFNFFFQAPFETFVVSDAQSWLELGAFLATAVIGARLAERAREEADEVRACKREMQIMLQLGERLGRVDDAPNLISMAPSEIVAATSASSVMLYLLKGDCVFQAGTGKYIDKEVSHLRSQASTLNSAQFGQGEVHIPLRSGVSPRGVLVMTGVDISAEMADAIGGLVSVLINRATDPCRA